MVRMILSSQQLSILDSELVAYQIQREQQEKQAYKDDLKH